MGVEGKGIQGERRRHVVGQPTVNSHPHESRLTICKIYRFETGIGTDESDGDRSGGGVGHNGVDRLLGPRDALVVRAVHVAVYHPHKHNLNILLNSNSTHSKMRKDAREKR